MTFRSASQHVADVGNVGYRIPRLELLQQRLVGRPGNRDEPRGQLDPHLVDPSALHRTTLRAGTVGEAASPPNKRPLAAGRPFTVGWIPARWLQITPID